MADSDSIIRPSQAAAVFRCPARIHRTRNIEDVSSPEAELGTACHYILEQALINDRKLQHEAGDIVNDIEITQEDIDAVEVAIRNTEDKEILLVEGQIDPGSFIGSPVSCTGTVDHVLTYAENQTLIVNVCDYKHGANIEVLPEDNYQLLLYALGVFNETIKFDNNIIFRLTIIQPRFNKENPIKSWDISIPDLVAYGAFFKEKIEDIFSENPKAIPGEIQCHWCLAKATCPELAATCIRSAQGIFEPVPITESVGELDNTLTSDPKSLTPEQIAFILEHKKQIKSWLEAVENYGFDLAMNGISVPGMKIVNGRGMKKWDINDSEIQKIISRAKKNDGKTVGKKATTKEKIISPAQAEKEIKPNVDKKTWERISKHIVKLEGKPQLVKESDKRDALIVSAAQIFEPIVKS